MNIFGSDTLYSRQTGAVATSDPGAANRPVREPDRLQCRGKEKLAAMEAASTSTIASTHEKIA